MSETEKPKPALHMRDADHVELCADQAAKGLEAERSVPTELEGWCEWVRTEAYDGFLNDLIERPAELLELVRPEWEAKLSVWIKKFYSIKHQMLDLKVISFDEWNRIDFELTRAANKFPWFPDEEEAKP